MSNPLALVIEDDVDLATIYAEALQAARYETEIIHDGKDALARLMSIQPALVLLDMHLPHVGGEDILRQIRADERLVKTRVVIATADPGSTVGMPNEQADVVFIKPIHFSQLRHLASRLRTAD